MQVLFSGVSLAAALVLIEQTFLTSDQSDDDEISIGADGGGGNGVIDMDSVECLGKAISEHMHFAEGDAWNSYELAVRSGCKVGFNELPFEVSGDLPKNTPIGSIHNHLEYALPLHHHHLLPFPTSLHPVNSAAWVSSIGWRTICEGFSIWTIFGHIPVHHAHHQLVLLWQVHIQYLRLSADGLIQVESWPIVFVH